MKQQLTMNVTCLFGLESVVRYELQTIGAKDIQVTDGRLVYTGDEQVLINSLLWLRTAERVSIVLGEFTATTFAELFDQVEQLPFEDYIGQEDAFPVTGWSVDSQLHSIPSCQSIIKRAAVKRLEKVYGIEQFPETGTEHQIRFSIHKDEVSILLDVTGDPLHKRGYRAASLEAPIRESLAAGIVDFARTREHDTVYDPMCGSGTLLIEAALRAINKAPGLNRSFAVEGWDVADKKLWEEERTKAKEAINLEVSFRGIGYDIDEQALRIARDNAALAGVEDFLTFTNQDISEFVPQAPSITVCNPPYGERLLEHEQVYQLYQTMGTVMPKSRDNTYYIIGPQHEFEKAFGRKADRRRKLYNGMIPTQLHMYFRG